MDVLLGIVGSDESMKALRATIERTKEVDDDLTIAVVEKPEAKRTPEEMAHQARELVRSADLDAEIRTLEGDPGSTLVEEAERGDFDQLVIGGGTESPMGKIRIGPITEFVLLNATTTVKLIR
ncbi:universal stress protein [Natrialbaceae archaeon AArc-T1-2]|uniref:universal stress protein n=1 Tax=Natrialbaceae archaeon AArc-T1-2 TaxID=3053904 RepID=UPI00255AF7BF|nr:universal stress protein [Natrialbaceae archaeon AArc-T1-2]WIV66463.1 universal stress protein [Natrialbaceae archaeon AArc-T1-2]